MDRCSERAQHLVKRRDRHALGVRRIALEAVDVVRPLQPLERQLTELLFEHLDAALNRRQATRRRRPDLSLEVRVEESANCLQIQIDRFLDLWRAARITPRLQLPDEQSLPVPRLLDGLDRPLLTWFHTRDREVVREHAIPRALLHHVELQVLQTATSVLARSAAAFSPDCHVVLLSLLCSFPSSCRGDSCTSVYHETFVGAPRAIQSNTSAA